MYMLGIILFAYFPYKLSDINFRKTVKSVYVAMSLFVIAALSVIVFNKSEKINFPYQKFAQDMSYAWKLHTDKPLKYVGGEIWYIANLSIFAEEQPKTVPSMRPELAPWFDKEDILKSGALVVFPNKNSYMNLKSIYPNMSEPSEYKLEFKNRIGKLKTKTIYWKLYGVQNQ